mgnify:CR=1 FL=1
MTGFTYSQVTVRADRMDSPKLQTTNPMVSILLPEPSGLKVKINIRIKLNP